MTIYDAAKILGLTGEITPKTTKQAFSGYSIDVDPHSGHIDPSVDFGLKKICSDKITVFF